MRIAARAGARARHWSGGRERVARQWCGGPGWSGAPETVRGDYDKAVVGKTTRLPAALREKPWIGWVGQIVAGLRSSDRAAVARRTTLLVSRGVPECTEW